MRVAERDVLAYLASAPKATPVAQKLAAEAGVDLRTVTGTGPGGKITKEDVEQAVTAAARPPVPAPAASARSPQLPSSPPFRSQPPTSPSASRSRACAPSSPTGWAPACTPRPA